MTSDQLLIELTMAWQKYEPQRAAERDAQRERKEAADELAALNAKRVAKGMTPVMEPVVFGSVTAPVWTPPSKTWRDDLDAELLAIVKRWLAQ